MTIRKSSSPGVASVTGNSGKYLTTDGVGTSWGTITFPSSGMTLIQESVAAGNNDITFSSVPGTYKSLLLIWSGLYTNSNTDYSVRFNSDSGSNYYVNEMSYSPSFAANASNFSYACAMFNNDLETLLQRRGMGYIYVDNYTSTTRAKTYWYKSGYYRDASVRGHDGVGVWDSLSAITTVNVARSSGTGTITNATNTSIRLYGVS